MLFSKIGVIPLLGLSWLSSAQILNVDSRSNAHSKRQQDIVTWDDKSLMINGERLMIFSAEFHPFRLPVPSLWLDVLQKIKALGYTCVSFYVDWHLLEGKQGEFRADGIFDLQPLFDAAKEAGLYLIARPGPYINAEVSGGGYPGWVQRVQGRLRTNDAAYLEATANYSANIGRIIAENQITKGGPVILYQPENEYQSFVKGYNAPDYEYWENVKKQFEDAGIVVPSINNEAHMNGYITTSTPANVDIYGHDSYPVGFDCTRPDIWPTPLATDWLAKNNKLAPDSPYALLEFQGGGFQPPGGKGFEACAILTNHEFERVVYKNNYAVGATIFNIYMTFGGTNWGNLGHAEGYTSYDYGSPITEERLVWREKYSEMKLQANFFHVSPAYLVADRFNSSLDWTNNPAITVTPGMTKTTKFYISRHTQYNSTQTVAYKLKVKTAKYGELSVPQMSDSLSLTRRDSKIHLSDYPVGDHNLVYSTAEVFTWKKYGDKTVLVVYGGPNEVHELAVEGHTPSQCELLSGSGVKIESKGGYVVANWAVTSERKVVRIGTLTVYMLNRNEAYNFYVPPVAKQIGLSEVIVKAGYLIRTVEVSSKSLNFVGDLNSTTTLEVIGGAPSSLKMLKFNGKSLKFKQDKNGVVTAKVAFAAPKMQVPKLGKLKWKKIDTLPELSSSYSDAAWTRADLKKTYNIAHPLRTPTSLYGGDYGYHTRTLIFRGEFTANSQEKDFSIYTQGGMAFGSTVWLNDEFVGSYLGGSTWESYNYTSKYTLPSRLENGKRYTFTVVVDNMGLDGNYVIPEDRQKRPRGIIDYDLSGHTKSDISWKLTGNLGGENYLDKVRGPLNEGGLWVERHGYHLPAPPTKDWANSRGPTEGIEKPGITFYSTSFDLDLPKGYDIPLSFTFANSTAAGTKAYRAQLFVNGYQFGTVVSNIGPQTRFPVPQGILDFNGKNYVGVSVWALEKGGAKVEGLELEVGMMTATSFDKIKNAPVPKWELRKGAY
ncbi:family 35 glycosyl hydrolase [Microdochium bolleyi]|uniref:Beta-galactosidase n=1 Tax=Microdochium bolleyi TaxID=196109 RepID=A0A136J2B0_9PEZI|nr:family 35 glycosyl hydrolase [Microdochium bolleyi]